MKKQIEVFRAGSFKSMSGAVQKFSQEDVRAIAEIYDPTTNPAPVVLGHPKDDSPAYGWASAFSVNDGGVLLAEIDQLDESLVEAVNKGRYKNISMSFFAPDAPSNPKQGFYYPKHIGFLGGAAPAVSGLAPVSLSDGGVALTVTLKPMGNESHVSFCATEQTIYSAREVERMQAHYKTKQRIEDYIRAGKLWPVHKEGMLEFVDSLENIDALTFSDGSEKSQKEWFFDFIDRLPTIIDFGESSAGEVGGWEEAQPASIYVPPDLQLDPEDAKALAQIESYAREKNISFADAAIEFMTKNRS